MTKWKNNQQISWLPKKSLLAALVADLKDMEQLHEQALLKHKYMQTFLQKAHCTLPLFIS